MNIAVHCNGGPKKKNYLEYLSNYCNPRNPFFELLRNNTIFLLITFVVIGFLKGAKYKGTQSNIPTG